MSLVCVCFRIRD